MTIDLLGKFLFWTFMGGAVMAALNSFWQTTHLKFVNQYIAIVLATLACGVAIAMLMIKVTT